MGVLVAKIRDNFALKIAVTFCALVIICSFFLVYLYIQERRVHRTDQMIKDGALLSQMLAYNSRMSIFTGSRDYLRLPVQGVMHEKDILEVYVSGTHWESPFFVSRENSSDISSFKKRYSEMIKKFNSNPAPLTEIFENSMEFWAPVVSKQSENPFSFRNISSKEVPLKVAGVVMVKMDRTRINSELNSFIAKIISIEIVFSLTGLFIIFFLVKKLTLPLSRLIKAVEVVGKGGTPDLVVSESDDEVGRLAKAFNYMIKSLKERDRALNAVNLDLEKKVYERTGDLLVSKNKLQKEVDQRKEMEVILKASEVKYRSIIESIDEGYFETDKEGVITFSNTSFGKYVNEPDKSRITGKIILDFVPEKEHEKLTALYLESVKLLKKQRETILYNGRFIEISLSPVMDGDKLKGARGFVQDVTERLRAEEHSKTLAKKFEEVQRLESIATLAGGIAHDFNNLLMGIQGNASLITVKCKDQVPIVKHVANIEKGVRRASDLTRELLGFARGGKSKLKPVTLTRTIKKSAEFFTDAKKEISIDEALADDLWVVEADLKQIEQVLLNIFVNAHNAMDGKGVLSIETENTVIDDDFVKPVNIKSGNFVRITIRDNGCGMDDNVKDRIFEPFYTTQPLGNVSGKGMGLASVFGIIKKHGGFINVESKKDIGSSFNIFLPATYKKLNITATEKKYKETLLLVDDEKMILEVGKPMLEEIGFKVITAKGHKEATEIYRDRKDEIKMVILDNAEDHEDFLSKEIKKNNPDMKVLLSSSFGKESSDHYDGFITKPFTITKLSKKISEIKLEEEKNH